MNENLAWWNKKQDKYAIKDWIDKPSMFAKWVLQFFPKEGKILELGAGQGRDTRFFASHGYGVVSTDFSNTALGYNRKKLPDKLKKKINIQQLDLSKPFPFEDNSFDAVYSHLSVHYFDDEVTNQIFSEIYRVLRPGGMVAILVNSINDPEYGMGKKLGKDFFELSPGDVKHFFSLEYMKAKTENFETIVLDNKGETYKDKAKGVVNLIRFVGRKNLIKFKHGKNRN